MSKFLVVTFMLGLVGLSGVAFGQSATLDPTTSQAIEEELMLRTTQVRAWEHTGLVLIILEICIILGGLAVSLMRMLEKERSRTKFKSLIVVIGGVIAAITTFSTTIPEANSKTYYRAAAEGRKLEIDVRSLLRRQVSTTDLDALQTKIYSDLDQIGELREKYFGVAAGPSTQVGLHLTSSAYAAEPTSVPDWLKDNYVASDGVHVVGRCDGPSLRSCESCSGDNARALLSDYMYDYLVNVTHAVDAKDNVDAIIHQLIRPARIAAQYFTFDTDLQVYQYYTLLVANAEDLGTAGRILSIRKRLGESGDLTPVIAKVSSPKRIGYFAVDLQPSPLISLARKTLAAGGYSEFLIGINYLQSNFLDSAYGSFRKVISDKPEFEPGLLYCAEACQHNPNCDPKPLYATLIQHATPDFLRVSHFFRSYGMMFFKGKDYATAVAQFQKGLDLDPNDLRLQRYIRMARQAMT